MLGIEKVLVTGTCGFIGSNIAYRLAGEGHEILGFDNLHTGNESNIRQIKNKVKLYRKNAGQIGEVGVDAPDIIIHYGIPSSTPMYKSNPKLTSTAIDEFLSILEYSRKNGSRIVLSSSSSMYNGLEEPFREDMSILVTDFYTEARYAMERLAELYYKLYGISTICLRNFSIYGPNETYKKQYANIITQFLWDFMKKQSPIIYGDGNQTRDFVYVDDAVNAVFKAMKLKKGFNIFNVGTGRSTTFNEVAEILSKKLNSDIKPKYIQNEIKNYVYNTKSDTSKSEKLLGFRAMVGLESGIEKLINCYSSPG